MFGDAVTQRRCNRPDCSSPAPLTETITGAVLALADVDTLGLVANDVRLSHAEVAARAAARAAWLQANRRDGAFHLALMLDNVPEFIFWLEAPRWPAPSSSCQPHTQRDELVRDLSHTECQFLISDSTYLPLVEALGSATHSEKYGATTTECSCSTPKQPGADSSPTPRPPPRGWPIAR